MKNSSRNWCLAVITLCLFVPAALADRGGDGGGGDHHGHGCGDGRSRGDCRDVPEGGSTAIYLLGAGLTCFGAMFLRSKAARSTQS
jgi:hypothetical protein